jgi:3-methylfumaryl-CoA hydratase
MENREAVAAELVETPTPTLIRMVAAMLDLDAAPFGEGSVMPRGWHFALLPATTARSKLRVDGFAGLGVALPDLGLPRLMLAARRVDYHADLAIGEKVRRQSAIVGIEHKGTPERRRAILTVRHSIASGNEANPAIVETQTFMLMPEPNGTVPAKASERVPVQAIDGEKQRLIVPDATLLFHFSALGFNAHKIHLDRDYARNVEGFPNLVVNGGLIALLVTEFARVDLGLTLACLDIRYKAPLFCDCTATIAASRIDDPASGEAWRITVHDESGAVAAEAKVIAT